MRNLALAHLADDAGYLPLSGSSPISVYAKVDNNGIPEFSATLGGTGYPNIEWTPSKGQQSMNFTFNFITGISTIQKLTLLLGSPLQLGPVSNQQQTLTCPASVATSAPNGSPFGVSIRNGDGTTHMVDPVIKVTIPPDLGP
jgi:hypothetical protein